METQRRNGFAKLNALRSLVEVAESDKENTSKRCSAATDLRLTAIEDQLTGIKESIESFMDFIKNNLLASDGTKKQKHGRSPTKTSLRNITALWCDKATHELLEILDMEYISQDQSEQSAEEKLAIKEVKRGQTNAMKRLSEKAEVYIKRSLEETLNEVRSVLTEFMKKAGAGGQTNVNEVREPILKAIIKGICGARVGPTDEFAGFVLEGWDYVTAFAYGGTLVGMTSEDDGPMHTFYKKLSLKNLKDESTELEDDEEVEFVETKAAPTKAFILICVHSVVASCIKTVHETTKLPEMLKKYLRSDFWTDFSSKGSLGGWKRSWDLWIELSGIYHESSVRLRHMFDEGTAFGMSVLTVDPLAPLAQQSLPSAGVPYKKKGLGESQKNKKKRPVLVIDSEDEKDDLESGSQSPELGAAPEPVKIGKPKSNDQATGSMQSRDTRSTGSTKRAKY